MDASGDKSNEKPRRAIRFSVVNTIIITVAIILASGLLLVTRAISGTNEDLQQITEQYIECEFAASEMHEASNYLTTQARMFTLTQNAQYLRRYIIEEHDTKRREHAIETLESYTENEEAQQFLRNAMQASEELMNMEHYAMKLLVVGKNMRPESGAEELESVALTRDDALLSNERKADKAKELLFESKFQASRDFIDRMVDQCGEELVKHTRLNERRIEADLDSLLLTQSLLACLLLAAMIGATIFHIVLFIKPLKLYTEEVNANKPLNPSGAAELQHLARAYNTMLKENERHRETLRHEAEHDPLTNLLNRSAYDKLYEEHHDNQALILLDIDYFKKANDDYGHEIGDATLKYVADSLRKVFRSSDHPCRIGGDEFAVIMTHMNSGLRHVVEQRLDSINAAIAEIPENLPPITLSIGVAFSEDADENISIYKAADVALYSVKESGRNGQAFYSDLPHDKSGA